MCLFVAIPVNILVFLDWFRSSSTSGLGSHMVAPHVFVWQVGVAACFAPGLVGASGGREFDQGILAVFAAIIVAFVIGAGVLIATNSMNALVPLPAMILLGLPIGTVGAGIAAWLSHRHAMEVAK
jgi:hypothetical protein